MKIQTPLDSGDMGLSQLWSLFYDVPTNRANPGQGTTLIDAKEHVGRSLHHDVAFGKAAWLKWNRLLRRCCQIETLW